MRQTGRTVAAVIVGVALAGTAWATMTPAEVQLVTDIQNAGALMQSYSQLVHDDPSLTPAEQGYAATMIQDAISIQNEAQLILNEG